MLARFRQANPDTVPGAPEWTLRLFQLWNQTMKEVTEILSRRITRADNLMAASRVVKFTTAPSVDNTFTERGRPTFKNELPVRPSMVWIGKVERVDGQRIDKAVSLTWTIDGQGNIALTYVAGLEPSTEYVMVLAYE